MCYSFVHFLFIYFLLLTFLPLSVAEDGLEHELNLHHTSSSFDDDKVRRPAQLLINLRRCVMNALSHPSHVDTLPHASAV